MKKKTILYIVGGAAVVGIAYWLFTRPKQVAVSPVYRVVNNPNTTGLAADITAAGNAAAAIINASNNGSAGSSSDFSGGGSGTSGSGSQPVSTMDTFPGNVYAVDTSKNIAGCGLYGDGSD